MRDDKFHYLVLALYGRIQPVDVSPPHGGAFFACLKWSIYE